jgi:hypothetical protein
VPVPCRAGRLPESQFFNSIISELIKRKSNWSQIDIARFIRISMIKHFTEENDKLSPNQGCKITPPFPPHHSKMVGWSVVIKITPPHHSKSGGEKKPPHPTIQKVVVKKNHPTPPFERWLC